MILLNPGPVTLSDRVRRALLQPDLCHREPEFFQLQDRIRHGLLEVYELSGDAYAAILITGSGTAAVEAMLISMIPQQGHLAVVENGVYGERMTNIAQRYGIPTTPIQHEWLAPIDTARVADNLANNPTVTHLAVVHHETTSGRLNQLEAIAELCVDRGIKMLVDTVSSFGAEYIDFARWPLAACAATANKCLHGIPGVSFVVVDRTALAAADNPARSLYLDLANYCHQQDQGGTPFTQSIPAFYALSEALAELNEQGGRDGRRQTYERRISRVRETLTRLEIKSLLPAEDCSVVLHGFYLPANFTYQRLHDDLKNEGFVIYAGQGELAKTLFRIATMGDISEADIERLLAALRNSISRN
jgi:2-aminoethylphosphonate-pyruvate transaminase